MKTVILDTNFLLIPYQFKINVIAAVEKLLEEAHEIVVSTAIVKELEGIAKSRGKDGIAARLALEIVKKSGIHTIKTDEHDADEWIMGYCAKHPGTIVCTNDINLRKELKQVGARVVVMRTRTRIFWA